MELLLILFRDGVWDPLTMHKIYFRKSRKNLKYTVLDKNAPNS